MKDKKPMVTINVEIDPDELKDLAENGKLAAFVDSLPVMLASSVKTKLVDRMAAGGLQVSHSVAFLKDDFVIPWPGPWPGPIPSPRH